MTNSILSIHETNRLKGLLILLVIMGHIEQFFSGREPLQMLLYSFHVVSFFMIPFLFNRDVLNSKSIVKNLRRIYIPYSIFFILAVMLFSFINRSFDIFSVFTAWLIGTGGLIKQSAGISVFWFFPAFFSTILFIIIYNTFSKFGRVVMLFLFFLTHLFISSLPAKYLLYFPLSSYVPFYLFFIGMVIKYLYNSGIIFKVSGTILTLLFILILYLSYGSEFNLASPMFPNILEEPIVFFAHDLIMILGFFTMIHWSRKIKFFEIFGIYSLAIFTIHPFVNQVLNKIYPFSGLIDGVFKYIVVVLTTYLLVRVVYFLNINKIVYPR